MPTQSTVHPLMSKSTRHGCEPPIDKGYRMKDGYHPYCIHTHTRLHIHTHLPWCSRCRMNSSLRAAGERRPGKKPEARVTLASCWALCCVCVSEQMCVFVVWGGCEIGEAAESSSSDRGIKLTTQACQEHQHRQHQPPLTFSVGQRRTKSLPWR